MDNTKFDKTKYKNNFNATKYDRFSLMLPKGKKETISQYATDTGESVNAFINRAIDEAIERVHRNEET